MPCSPRTMIKTAAALGGILAVAYLAFPDARAFVAASAPVLLALICPISMVLMMVMMRKPDGSGSCAPAEPPRTPAAEPISPRPEVAHAKEISTR